MKKIVTLGLAFAAAGVALAQPSFVISPEIYAAPDVPCNVYYARIFDSCVSGRYLLEAVSSVGSAYETSWSWTPTAADAGRRVKLVLNAWDDDGLVTSATTTVVVARAPSAEAKARKVTLALLAASDTNCRYQDQLRERMLAAGFANYTPVGSHSGSSASSTCDPAKGAPHDGYGGYTWDEFMTRYAFAPDEIEHVQAAAEREQMKQFGEKIPEGQEWMRALLKSPLVRWDNGKKVLDIPRWFDKINGGKAPDYLVVELGGNRVAFQRPDANRDAVDGEVRAAAKLLDALRAVAPRTRIAVLTSMGGSLDQDSWGRNYGARQHCRHGLRAFLDYDRKMAALCRARKDPDLIFVSAAQNTDPMGAYPTGRKTGNAMHATREGGKALGDAIFAWLISDIANR